MKTLGLITTGMALLAIVFLISVVIIKVSWGWVVPELFPGAVSQRLVIAKLDWNIATKLALVLGALGRIFAKASSSSSKS